MDAQMNHWTPVREALPEEGEPVQFSFNERTLVLRGVFRCGAFASRWSRYLPVEISSWRRLDPAEARADGDTHRLAGFEYAQHEEDVRGTPAGMAPSWTERPAREGFVPR